MLLDLIIPFISILLSEFGDKTQIAVLSMSSKTKSYFKLFMGVFFAFLIIDGVAIYFGDVIVNLIPLFWVKIISGLLFLGFGLYGLFGNEQEDEDDVKMSKKIKSPFFTAFTLIFFAEIGDKSQIASALFGSLYNFWFVLFGVMLALSLLTIMAIYLGKYLLKKFDKDLIEKIANWLFVVIGCITLGSLLF